MISENEVRNLLDLEAKATEGPWSHYFIPPHNHYITHNLFFEDGRAIGSMPIPNALMMGGDHILIAESRNLIKKLCESWLKQREILAKIKTESMNGHTDRCLDSSSDSCICGKQMVDEALGEEP